MKISVVIPIYNEEGNIEQLYQELKQVLGDDEYEIIYIDDCSRDKSLSILRKLFEGDTHVQVITLLGNHGQTAALNAGFHKAKGDVIVAMDGDGQHDPKYIPEFISAIEEGYDVASSWKQEDESSSKIKFALSNIAHKIIGGVAGAKMKYFGATMKAYRWEILQNLDLSGELHRFAGALIYYRGIKIKEIPIIIRARKRGKANYGLKKVIKVALDLLLIKFLVKYSKTPFRIFGSLGVLLIIIGLIGLIYVL